MRELWFGLPEKKQSHGEKRELDALPNLPQPGLIFQIHLWLLDWDGAGGSTQVLPALGGAGERGAVVSCLSFCGWCLFCGWYLFCGCCFMFLVISKMQMQPSHKLKAIPTFYQGKGRGSWGQSEHCSSSLPTLTLFHQLSALG